MYLIYCAPRSPSCPSPHTRTRLLGTVAYHKVVTIELFGRLGHHHRPRWHPGDVTRPVGGLRLPS
jgi:hypothetical protein